MRCGTRAECEKWREAIATHIVEDFNSQYLQPVNLNDLVSNKNGQNSAKSISSSESKSSRSSSRSSSPGSSLTRSRNSNSSNSPHSTISRAFSLLNDNVRTIILDIGSSSIRAGFLFSDITLPQLFFPSVLAIDRTTREHIWGIEALRNKSNMQVTHPFRQDHRISKVCIEFLKIYHIF